MDLCKAGDDVTITGVVLQRWKLLRSAKNDNNNFLGAETRSAHCDFLLDALMTADVCFVQHQLQLSLGAGSSCQPGVFEQ